LARINFETDLFKDSRFLKLALKLGCQDRAIGALVRMWFLAQKWHLKAEDRRIPLEEWRKQDIPDAIIESGLAESNGRSVRAAGADEQFAWLLQRVEAGHRSAEARKRSKGTAQPPNGRSTDTERPLNEPERLRTSLLFTPSSSLSSPNSELKTPNSEERGKGQLALPDLLEVWNGNCGSLPRCNAMNKSRSAKWGARWRERPELEYWQSVVQRLASSNFCNGDNDRGWKASVDFFLQADAHLKAMEGKYDNRSKGPLNLGLAQMVREGKI